ncbi:hypothetical protein JRO89_XS09G0008900 [Xanthoceras sorbifolium]|uniref:Leucine-rich repeat-containing N-terminal plant-type domain-containing protein n=1 Tax=Xanthoceras sorbifolium TaxID=99658 RepID=A0ABQ8HK22_9ROSI|nr:hypothetical protein JRO89_XS09G0008900 [Xanthoceras sorbifolium]
MEDQDFGSSSALLQFKQLFSYETSTYLDCWQKKSVPKMKNWEEDTDCCSWAGVTCDMVTGDVIGLDLSCSHLQLQGSIPSNSSLFLLLTSEISTFLATTLINLEFLLILVPFEISRLSKLVYLDLSYNYYLRLETPVVEGELPGKHLPPTKPTGALSVSLSLSTAVEFDTSLEEILRNQSNLMVLDLSDNKIHGQVPNWVLELIGKEFKFNNGVFKMMCGDVMLCKHDLDFVLWK